MAPRSFCPQHTDEETSSSSRNINILAGPSALTCPHLRQFKTTKAFILATKCLGKWEKVGTLFQPANFSSNSAFGTTWQAWIPKVSIKLKLWWKRLKAAKFWLKTHHDGSVRAREIFFINAYGKHFKEEIGSQRQDLVRPPLPFLGIIPKNTSFYHYPKNRCVESPVLMVKVVFQPFHLRTLRILELFTNPSDEEPCRG